MSFFSICVWEINEFYTKIEKNEWLLSHSMCVCVYIYIYIYLDFYLITKLLFNYR